MRQDGRVEFLIAGGALVTHAAVAMLAYARGRRLRPPKPMTQLDPMMCRCQHGISFHEDDGGSCHARSPSDKANDFTCRCLRFVSQDPLRLSALKELESD